MTALRLVCEARGWAVRDVYLPPPPCLDAPSGAPLVFSFWVRLGRFQKKGQASVPQHPSSIRAWLRSRSRKSRQTCRASVRTLHVSRPSPPGAHETYLSLLQFARAMGSWHDIGCWPTRSAALKDWGKAARHPSRRIFLSSVFLPCVSKKKSIGACITAYRYHIASGSSCRASVCSLPAVACPCPC